MGEAGSVIWKFDKKGVFNFDMNSIEEEKLLSAAIDAGAEDVLPDSDAKVYEVFTDPGDFHKVKTAFDAKGFKYAFAGISMIPKTPVKVEGAMVAKVLKFVEAMEDLDDVQEVFADFGHIRRRHGKSGVNVGPKDVPDLGVRLTGNRKAAH